MLLVGSLGFLNLQARDLSSRSVENLVRYAQAQNGPFEAQSFGYPFHYTAFGDWTNHGYPRPDSGVYGEYFDIGW